MIFAQQQHARTRKEALVPKATDEMIEVLSVIGDVMSVETGRYIEIADSPESQDSEGSKPRKRAKLDHLSAEEKAQHRKMMNRISAQSARDRQKCLMHQQDLTIKSMANANENLKKENAALCAKVEKLSEENERLNERLKEYEEKLGLVQVKTEPVASPVSPVVNAEETISSSLEPAVPRTVPLPKGPELLRSSLSCIPTLLSMCLLWILTHQSSSKLSKTSQNKSLALEAISLLDSRKLCLPSASQVNLHNMLRNQMRLLGKARILEPG